MCLLSTCTAVGKVIEDTRDFHLEYEVVVIQILLDQTCLHFYPSLFRRAIKGQSFCFVTKAFISFVSVLTGL